jgi:Protein of unknown function (DUF3443)
MKQIAPAALYLCLLLTGCPSSGGDNSAPAPSGAANVISVSVGTSNVCTNVNELCASVTICQPGTSTCQTISDVLVDIGSVGVRVFDSVLSTPLRQGLQQAVDAQGHPLGECAFFADGSMSWGPVQIADVVLGGGPAVRVPIQVIAPTFAGQTISNNPCNGPVDSDPGVTSFNGILGIGIFKQDCGPVCELNNNNNLYFSCVASSCTSTTMPVLNQLQNPVWMLSSGNNGVVLAMPNVPANGAPSVTGSLIMGIGTADNNTPPAGLSVLRTDGGGLLSTNYKGQVLDTIIDSGSNGLFFPDANIPPCTNFPDFYCPANPLNLMATLMGFNGVPQIAVPFQVANTANLVQTNNAAFNNLGGSSGSGPFSSFFDWGLPFFFGRTVFVGIEEQTSPLGTGPYFAF